MPYLSLKPNHKAIQTYYIVRLIGQVITVSVETVKTIKNLPALDIVEV